MNHSTHKLAEQEISSERSINVVVRHDVVFQPSLRASCCDKSSLIRVIVIDVDHGVKTTFEDVGDLEFEVATLVPTESQTSHIITLHEHPIWYVNAFVGHRLLQPIKRFNRCI